MRVVAVVPAYNEEKTIGQVITNLKDYVDEIIVINDGSTDRTAEIVENLGVKVYHHFLNRGLGAALKTGFQAALMLGADIIVTFDADRQHRAEDIPRLITPIEQNKADVVIGSRFLKRQKIPWHRFFYNQLANFITFLLYGFKVTDSQSGLRAFSRNALKKIKLSSEHMEVSSEIIKEIKNNNLRYQEISICPIYSDYSMSKGQNFILGLKTFAKLLIDKFNDFV